jgi:hypothetical protein
MVLVIYHGLYVRGMLVYPLATVLNKLQMEILPDHINVIFE